jgi:hypothetical protein
VKSLQEMSIGEVAAYVADHLRQSGINVVLAVLAYRSTLPLFHNPKPLTDYT